MHTFKKLLIFIFLSFVSVTLPELVGAKTSPNFLTYYCQKGAKFEKGDPFDTNLNLLLSNLTTNAHKSMFNNYTVGETTDGIYGLFLCQGDTTTQICNDCVTAAAETAQFQCPFDVGAMVWYEECFLRYSNRSFFGIATDSPVYLYHLEPSDYDMFGDSISSGLRDVISKATSSNSSLAFARKVVSVTSSLTLNCYAECTPDTLGLGCDRCLESAFGRSRTWSSGSKYSTLLHPSCKLRYIFNGIVASPAAPPPSSPSNASESLEREVQRHKLYLALLAAFCSTFMVIGLLSIGVCLYKRKVKRVKLLYEGVDDMEKVDNLQFDFSTIIQMTDNFSEANMIGRGGFGAVYKGCLPNGQAIAVKRLSSVSMQGIQEFKTEASFLAKLQHKNLVKLYGFCVNGDEKLLVYEFLPNKSLDRFLSDPNKLLNLSWETRYKIIMGVARGLQYLHEDSRFRIIHRDLKSSNILLDADFNPKISDFGIAKLFELHQTQGNTSRVVGTYGYMAPEYATSGKYSTKSDVYSFGIILLELVSGKLRGSSSLLEEGFLSNAWGLWNSGKSSDLLDPSIDHASDTIADTTRYFHIGLLCVQEDPSKRPDIALVVTMLNSPSTVLPLPMSPSSKTYNLTSTSSSTTQDY